MFTNIYFVAIVLLTTLTGVSHGAPLNVYAPPLITPAEGAVWIIGTNQTVTWDTSRPPTQITQRNSRLILSKGGRLDVEHPLAKDFDIMDGQHTVTVPILPVGDDYQLILFGDSGNAGPTFSIQAAPSQSSA
ncbi:hypothetical protein AGABI1DRAFT_87906 [Agaricus bisporus var. burnettii JB137-S8]|uniref:Yeast cell wall synthesis Kre9/Knh1-like N-terminal domain-containing protein n=1 Tax=Agaricus bisporus var. burnettii (strain JB137-S8 / ATCC MYA-4627 / FGSC 10392) TaxID=597362 RepID=K5XLE0_AGABU|nr:uncharacterized protein AGABI1DRAFT_87906 [Agaricus bisporus var. burnettii JB137-S8]EKM75345.1 hypothetical protein AGABI1DRAFT_87906 [Agaricus bisporus var. burnettii JB137-S8]